MTSHLLVLVAVHQGLLLAALSGLILLHRWFRRRRHLRMHPLELALGEAMRRWVIGQGDAATVLAALRRLPISVAVERLLTWAARVPGDRWQELAFASVWRRQLEWGAKLRKGFGGT